MSTSGDESEIRPPAAARVVFVTAPDLPTARELARELVGRRIAACVNLVGPVTSIYRWKGAVEEEGEVLLVVKTSARRIPDLEDFLARRHPYDVPECVALVPASVAPGYLAWLLESCDPEDSGDGSSRSGGESGSESRGESGGTGEGAPGGS